MNKKLDYISYIGMSSHDNFKYAIQYKSAFEILYNSINNDIVIDSIALPLMYTLRHYLELILKANIEYFSKYLESITIVNINNGHKLIPLKNAFQEHWNAIVLKYKIKIDDEIYFNKLDKLIDIIEELDKNSMSFRYSHNNDDSKTKHFDWLKQLDIYFIKKLFDEVVPLLNYSIDVFDSHVEKLKK